jgi:hypothetical protein
MVMAGLAAVGVLAVLWSCQPGATNPDPMPSNSAAPRVSIDSPDQVFPANAPDSPVQLIVAGYEVKDVDMKTNREGGLVRLVLTAHDEVLQEEHYRLDESGLYVAKMVGESFEPPLPLLKFPSNGTSALDYAGKVTVGRSVRDVKATIRTAPEVLNTLGGQFDSMKVTVALDFGAGQSRQLVFWVSPGQGVVKREYGSEATRAPAPRS